ncbi:hypothetical protein M9H77_12906 [Catharanthus roseus]|uniref:Uncharacterized protein n=1 Tax=Catharanthus roseus TaxID=4058 RepID=A0ACC0BIS8_CATRO|nr:hypothetical protein M9H77_12906 [Catharanthus roseus]
MVTRELTEGYKTPWPGEGKLISSALSLKYFGLKKISCTNWMPTTNVSLLSRDSCDVVFHRYLSLLSSHSSPSNLCIYQSLLLSISNICTGFSFSSFNSRLSLFKVTYRNFVLNLLFTESLIHNFLIASSKRGN